MLNQIVRFCTKYMSIGVVLIGIFSIFWPEVMKPFAPKIPTLLGIIMFGMGMSLTPGDFKNVFKQPKNVAIGTVLQFIIMPAAAFALIHLFALPPEIAIGVVLVGCCPGGTASNVISYIAKADVALSVSMTMVNTILTPFVTPFLVWLIAGAWVDIDFMSMMMSIALRFIPTLIEETDKIMSAQRARGADFESGNLLQRAKALIPLLVPLFVSAFRRADELATAMECRCYHGGEGRTKLHVLRYETRDYLTLAFYAALCAAMIALKKFF